MKFYSIALLFLISIEVSGQTFPSDSMAWVLEAASVEAKVNLLNNASAALKDADMKRSFEYATEAYKLARESTDEIGLANAHINLGRYYTRLGLHQSAMENYLSALKIAQQKHNDKLVGVVYKIIGNGYYFRNDNELALRYYQLALQTNATIKDEETTADLQNNIALIFINTNKPDSALLYLLEAVDRYEKLNKSGKLANTFLNIGEVKVKTKDYDGAIIFYARALKINQTLGLKLQEGYALNNLSKAFIYQGKYKNAEDHVAQALAIANQEKFRPLLQNIYENLYFLNKERKNITEALRYHEQLLDLKDSLFNEQKNKQIEELRTKYESEQKERENEILTRESILREDQLYRTKFSLLFIIIFALVATLLAAIYYKSLVQNRSAKNTLMTLNKQVQEQNEEITSQADELIKANQEIASININLESLVNEKTSKIIVQNEKLIQYAYHNAHKVRGPLARILGLVNLVRSGAISKDETEFILLEIDNASKELDSVIKEINNLLKEEDFNLH